MNAKKERNALRINPTEERLLDELTFARVLSYADGDAVTPAQVRRLFAGFVEYRKRRDYRLREIIHAEKMRD